MVTLSIRSVAETCHYVIVYHSRRLHHCIAGRWSNKTETHLLEFLAHHRANFRDRRQVSHTLPLIDDWITIHEAPKEVTESVFIIAEVLDEGFCVIDCGINLGAVANDTRIAHKP